MAEDCQLTPWVTSVQRGFLGQPGWAGGEHRGAAWGRRTTAEVQWGDPWSPEPEAGGIGCLGRVLRA